MSARTLILAAIGAATLGVPQLVCAKVPQSQPLTRYSRLWQDSPVTSKPVVASPVAGPGALDEWALGGVSETDKGFLIVLLNRTKPEDRRIVSPWNNGGFEVVQVRRDPKNYLQTEVELRYKGQTGWVRYEQSLLAIKAPAPARQQGQPNQPGGNRDPRAAFMEAMQQRQQQGNGNGNGNGRSRERTVPTPPSSSSSRR